MNKNGLLSRSRPFWFPAIFIAPLPFSVYLKTERRFIQE
jgi:hypothetical protein